MRAWAVADGAALGAATIGGTSADRVGPSAIVQCVAATGAAAAAAACGCSVVALSRAAGGALVAAPPRPPLPSVVTALQFSGTDCLVAGTMHSGAFVWRGAQLHDLSGAPALALDCRASIISFGAAAAGTFVARCSDSTVRVWAPGAADDRRVDPMTFGGLCKSAGRAGCQAAGCAVGPADGDAGGVAAAPAPSLLVLADAGASVISWRLDAIAPEALGIDTRRAGRTAPFGGRAVLCLALRQATGVGDDVAPALACGCDDGTVAVMWMAAAGGEGEAPEWGRPTELTTVISENRPSPITQLVWAGAWVCAATQDGDVCGGRVK